MARKKFLPSWALWAGAIGVGYLLIKSQSGSVAGLGAYTQGRTRVNVSLAKCMAMRYACMGSCDARYQACYARCMGDPVCEAACESANNTCVGACPTCGQVPAQ